MRTSLDLRDRSSIASGRVSALGTKCFRARPPIQPGRHGTFDDVRKRARLRERAWVSTCCICRRFTRSDASAARARTMRLPARREDPGSPWAIGAAEGGHKDCWPQLGTLDDFKSLVEAARAHRHRDSAGHRFPMRARSSVRARASGMVSLAARRHSAVCRKSAEEVPGHLSVQFRERRLVGTVGGIAQRVRILDRARACAFSASTTRTPSRSASGNG